MAAAHLTQRALASWSAELTRRERVLAAAGAKDIEEYTERGSFQPRHLPLPRLVIVIDEFASLIRDLPDFVTGLVGIAQRGRSLGIHLILATQRPSGVVSANIRANTNLRIALRVTDAAESADVIDAPDAAQISRATPGPRLLRLGHASLVPFQAGRIGGHSAAAARSGRSSVLTSMTRSFLAGGAQVILVTPRPSPLRSLAAAPGIIRSFEQSDLGTEELAAAIASLTGPGAVVIDDADLLADCEAGPELSKIITRAAGRPLALVLAGDPDTLASGFGGWLADARRARRGCLAAPQTPPEGDLIGIRLPRDCTGRPPRPGRALLNAGEGTLTTVPVPFG